MHSTASDGGYTPSELMRKCYNAGLSIVSLTDHDTTNGIKEAKEEASKLNLTVINGIELSTKNKGKSVHILGYGMNIEDNSFQKILEEQRQMREDRLHIMLEKLKAQNITLHPEDVLKHVDGGSIGRPHVAMALVEKSFVANAAEAFDLYLAEGKPCYVEKAKEFSPQEAIQLIKGAGGLAVVAHPVYYGIDRQIKQWIKEEDLDGVEVYHRDHDYQTVKYYERLVYAWEKEIERDLLKTGGSDFHHETYGRKIEPVGTTTVSLSLANKLLDAVKQGKRKEK
ncbi:PHP domain-containing protein [Alteribacillus sp. JSM 102045]|uniref:PHP domain-containing protein n=1 Tax=Alteribacillus sp. JSM 102045 TaxID=1562101 RepID=UPI0035C2404F